MENTAACFVYRVIPRSVVTIQSVRERRKRRLPVTGNNSSDGVAIKHDKRVLKRISIGLIWNCL